jgi:hypothetical protein
MSNHRRLSCSLALAALVLSAGCKTKEREIRVPAPAEESREPQVVLRAYDVPEGQGPQVHAILSSVFRGVKDKVAALTPDGQLVVVAPEGIHQGLESLLGKMKGRKAVAPPSIEITYWLVVGRSAAETSLGAQTGEIEPALEAVARAQGPMEFALLDKMRVRALSDARGHTTGRYARVQQVASVSDGKVVADLDCSTEGSRFETRVAIPPGKLLVLGEAGFEPPPGLWSIRAGAKRDASASTLFYVVRADVEADAG